MLNIRAKITPPLDASFLPAVLWNRAYRERVANDRGARSFAIVLQQADGTVSRHDSRVLAADHPLSAHNLHYAERLLKLMLWQKGGCEVQVSGADEIARHLAHVYSPGGARAFDYQFMGEKVYGRPFQIRAAAGTDLPRATVIQTSALGRHLDGCRIGFDLGGSDRKTAAVIDGKVVFSEEIPWDPYFQKDPAYHIEGVHDSLKRAAAHLPRVDAIGGSAAGVYVNNEVRTASLFRGITPELFERDIRRMFFTLRERWGGVPFEVVNDGEVTALAGSMALGEPAVLGVSMGTSQAGGFVTPQGGLTPWLNELAFAPIDYRPDAPRDEWSGDVGCGVQYFSQQGVARLATLAGLGFAQDMPLPERLVAVQDALQQGSRAAREIYESIGVYFGYALAHYAEFYEARHVLLLGRVASGRGGEVILDRARAVLQAEFPAVAASLALHTPDEKERRHGQAIAAASLPALRGDAALR